MRSNTKKKFLALLVVMTMLASICLPAFAADAVTTSTTAEKTAGDKANVLHTLNLYKGTSETEFVPSLETKLTRDQGITMILRLMGLEDAALALSDTETDEILTYFTDADQIATWAKKLVAYAKKNNIVSGFPDKTARTNEALTGNQYSTLILKATGNYDETDANAFQNAAKNYATLAGLDVAKFEALANEQLIREFAVDLSYASLEVVNKTTGKTVIQSLINSGDVDYTKAKVEFPQVTEKEVVTATGVTVSPSTTPTVTTSTIVVESVTGIDESSNRVALEGSTTINADKDTPIIVKFNNTVKSTDVNTTNFKLYTSANVVVPIDTPSLRNGDKEVYIYPVSNLSASTSYKLVVASALSNSAGTATLGTNKEVTFSTGSSLFISGAITMGVSGTSVTLSQRSTTNVSSSTDFASGAKILLDYNKALDSSSINGTNVRLYDVTAAVYRSITATVAGTRMTVTLAEDLVSGNLYQLKIENVKGSLAENVQKDSIGFVCGATALTFSFLQPDRSTAIADGSTTLWPKLTSGQLDGNTGIQNAIKLFAKLNTGTQGIDVATLSSSTLYLEKLAVAGDTTGTKVEADLVYDATYRIINITPKADLAEDSIFRITLKHGVNGIKDEYGQTLSGNDDTTTFNTYDLTSPTIIGAQYRANSGANFAAVDSGVTNISYNKNISFTFQVSEDFGTIDGDNSDFNATVSNSTFSRANSVGFDDATEAFKIVDASNTSSADYVIDNGNYSVSKTTSDNKYYLQIDINSDCFGTANDYLQKGHTYNLIIAGNKNNPTGSVAANLHTLADLESGSHYNRLQEAYTFAFTIEDNDTTAPQVSNLKVNGYDSTGTVKTSGTVKWSTSDDIYVIFNELMNLDTLTPNTTVKLQSYNQSTGVWSDVTIDNSEYSEANVSSDYSYVKIDKGTWTTDTKYRVQIVGGTGKAADTSGNVLATNYNFELVTGSGPVVNTTAATGAYPAAFATGLSNEIPYIVVTIDDADSNLDSSTLTQSNITVKDSSGANAPCTLTYKQPTKKTISNTVYGTTSSKVLTGTAVTDVTVGDILTIASSTYVVTDKTSSDFTVDRNLETAASNSPVTAHQGVAFKLNTGASLTGNMEYKVSVGEGVKDSVGNTASATTYTFKTASTKTPTIKSVEWGYVSDTTGQDVLATLDLANSVRTDAFFVVSFDDDMRTSQDSTSADYASNYTLRVGGTLITAKTVWYDNDNDKAYIYTDAPLNASQSCELIVSGQIKSSNSSKAVDSKTVTFKTDSWAKYFGAVYAKWDPTSKVLNVYFNRPIDSKGGNGDDVVVTATSVTANYPADALTGSKDSVPYFTSGTFNKDPYGNETQGAANKNARVLTIGASSDAKVVPGISTLSIANLGTANELQQRVSTGYADFEHTTTNLEAKVY